MKLISLKSPLMLLVFAILLSACGDDDGVITDEPTPLIPDESVATQVVAEFIDDDIEKMVLYHLFNYTQEIRDEGGVIETHMVYNPYENRIDCSLFVIDKENGFLSIDFGSGCAADNGIVRKGKVLASFGSVESQDFMVVIDLEDYALENIKVSGQRTLTIIPGPVQPYGKFLSSIPNGVLEFSDETTYTYRVEKTTRSHTVSAQAEDQFIFTSEITKNGTNRNGESFQITDDSTVEYSSVCFEQGTGQATGGLLNVTISDITKTINFVGNCEKKVMITEGDTVYEVDLSDLLIN